MVGGWVAAADLGLGAWATGGFLGSGAEGLGAWSSSGSGSPAWADTWARVRLGSNLDLTKRMDRAWPGAVTRARLCLTGPTGLVLRSQAIVR